ncbi:hypothetical protein D3C71_2247910 [compost metagenome]
MTMLPFVEVTTGDPLLPVLPPEFPLLSVPLPGVTGASGATTAMLESALSPAAFTAFTANE